MQLQILEQIESVHFFQKNSLQSFFNSELLYMFAPDFKKRILFSSQ